MNSRKYVCLFAAAVLSASSVLHVRAQTFHPESPGQSANPAEDNPIRIDSVVVTSHRYVHLSTGIQKTVIEAIVLKENPVASMADILSENTPVFIKSYGRATLSTASTRGTAPSHTQVEWNGMNINSPMLGMVDFSYIPSSFIDKAVVLYGASSTGFTGGGLGGAVVLGTKTPEQQGFGLSYTQGISSFNTFDQFLKTSYGNGRLQGGTRIAYTASKNDFPYVNRYKKKISSGNIDDISDYPNPVERNRNCAYRDLHLLQEIYLNADKAGEFKFSGWFMDSDRGIPLISSDWGESSSKKAQQGEKTLRTVIGWDKILWGSNLQMGLKGGYIYSDIRYYELQDSGNGIQIKNIDSRSYINTFSGKFDSSCKIGDKWILALDIAAYQHLVDTRDLERVTVSPDDPIGYQKARAEFAGLVSVRYKPTERTGLAMNVRSEICGTQYAPFIPALFFDYALTSDGSLMIKASIARNYRFPTLNDLYFQPGGNPVLLPEKGFSYDGGLELRQTVKTTALTGRLTLYDSYIEDWILWRPSKGGFFSPINIKQVHTYGVEAFAGADRSLQGNWRLKIDGKLAFTRSVNRGEPISPNDRSIGRQLPYIPVWSSSVHGRLSYKDWTFLYRWNYYSERFTSTDNDDSLIGNKILQPYFMNDIAVELTLTFNWSRISLRFAVNNVFNEEYESELSRPMPGRNFGVFLEITPDFRRR